MITLIDIELNIKRIFNVLELESESESESSLTDDFNEKYVFEFWKRGKSYSIKIPIKNDSTEIVDLTINDGLFYTKNESIGSDVFLNVTVLNTAYRDFYIMIISDLVFRCFETNYNINAIIERYQSWREFIKLINVPKTDIGLWGELKFLDFILVNGVSNIQSWTGPEFSTHDFKIKNRFFEIKTTSNKYKNLISINGMLQLNSNEETGLCFMRIEKDNTSGESLKDLITKISNKLNSLDQALFENKWSRFSKIINSSTDKYNLVVNQIYIVDENFPKISQNSFKNDRVPKGISYISYTVDLSNLEYINTNDYFN